MSFDSTWLTLREPADKAARDPQLLSAFTRAVPESATILDIGCGTGSTFRTIAPHLAHPVRWLLADNDPALLAHAAATGAETLLLDLNDPLPKADFITASALFDLCSPAFIQRIAAARTGLYAALNYDGTVTWSAPHAQDAAILDAFNADQRRDKGFGPATGPDATAILAEACTAAGLHTRTAQSPWLIGPADTDLHIAFINGMADAVANSDTWRKARTDAARRGASCRVGHLDLLALPG